MKTFWSFIRKSIDVNSSISTRSICCLLGGILGAFIVFAIIFVILFDVIKDGEVNSDLNGLSILLTANAVYVFGSSASKLFTKRDNVDYNNDNESKDVE